MTFETEKTKVGRNDLLALERSKLANERTLLSYLRTAITFLSIGLAIIKLQFMANVAIVGESLIVLAPIVLIFGIYRFYAVKKRLLHYF